MEGGGGEGGQFLARMNVLLTCWLYSDCTRYFFQLQPFARFFFDLLPTILAQAVSIAHLLSLTSMSVPRSSMDFLRLAACSDRIRHTVAVRAVDCLAFRHGQPLLLVLSLTGCRHSMLPRYTTSMSQVFIQSPDVEESMETAQEKVKLSAASSELCQLFQNTVGGDEAVWSGGSPSVHHRFENLVIAALLLHEFFFYLWVTNCTFFSLQFSTARKSFCFSQPNLRSYPPSPLLTFKKKKEKTWSQVTPNPPSNFFSTSVPQCRVVRRHNIRFQGTSR